MDIKHIYSGQSTYDGKIVTGQLIIVKEENGVEHYYIAEEKELNTHSFYGVNPDAFVDVLPESICAAVQ